MSPTAVSEETDKHQYLINNPQFRRCRSRKRGKNHGHQLPDWDTVPMTLVQGGDPRNPVSATHHMVMTCSRCGAKLVERYRLVVVRDRKTKRLRVKSYMSLGSYWDYSGTNGYLFGGGERIAPGEAAEIEHIERIENAADFPGAVLEPAPPRKPRKAVAAPVAPRKAVAAARKAS
jgi:hypothetical protein